jgi:hypothetical protein
VNVVTVGLVSPGGVPVTVIRESPAGVEATVLMVKVEEAPAIVGVTELLVNAEVAPDGRPVADRLTDCAVPETNVAVIFVVPVPAWPCKTVISPVFVR